MFSTLFAICLGASLGALSRWGLTLALNGVSCPFPLGTLAANLSGGYCIGLALGIFSLFPDSGPAWRLGVITGFLGSLTTFSAFSAEVCLLLQQQRMAAAFGAVAAHVGGSLCMTFLGMGSFIFLRNLLR